MLFAACPTWNNKKSPMHLICHDRIRLLIGDIRMIATEPSKDKGSEGRRRADRELDLHEAENREFMLLARRRLIELLRTTSQATIDDLRELITIPASVRGVMLGAIPKALLKAGAIRRVGFVESTRPESHARPISAWSICDATAAVKWLEDHPAPVPVTPPTVQGVLFNAKGYQQ